jgi:hypothetical protein
MKLDIILRTHSTSDVHPGQRYTQTSKREVVLRCTKSLINSINLAEGDIHFTIIDDHSTEDCVQELKKMLALCKHKTTFVALEGTGVQESAIAQFTYGREHGREVVYFIEDDYLHTPSAISEMMNAYELFKKRLNGQEVALFPTDYPDFYRLCSHELTRIVYGEKRHWRVSYHTTNTCWLSHKAIVDNWQGFATLGQYYGTVYGVANNITEENTINRMWREDITLFSPIPSVALHMQFEEHKDPFIDWKSWWDAAAY